MNRVTRSFVVTGAAAILSSCGQSTPPSQGPGKTPAPSTTASLAAPTVHVTKSGIEMIRLPGGEFSMGSTKGNADEAPVHTVQVDAFWIDKFEVTHGMFARAQLPNPSHWQDNSEKPVERVRWRDAKQYCNERSLLEGLKPCYNEKTMDWDCDYAADGYRLPTEAEWEYAAGGSEVLQPDKLRQFAWFTGNSDQRTHPVGQKKPNRWGLCDMFGNVSEWCEDVYSPTFYKESTAANPRGPANAGKDVKRVIRGGSWKSSAEGCRPSARQGEQTGDSDACFSTDFCGFRCVRRDTGLRGENRPSPLIQAQEKNGGRNIGRFAVGS